MRAKTDDYTAGDLRQPVIVQRVTYTPDDSGGKTKVWSDAFTIFCFVTNKSGSEQYSDGSTGRVRMVETWEFTTWWRTDMDVTQRLSWDGRLWNIRDIENIMGRNKFARISAEAGVEQ